jgi:hypothetical protein
MLFGEEEVDFGTDFEEGFGEPGGGFVLGREALEEAAGAIDGGLSGIQDPVADQISGQKHTTSKENSGIAKEPRKGLAHHFGGSHCGEEAEEPKGAEETESGGVHGWGVGRE